MKEGQDVYREAPVFAPVEEALKDPLLMEGYYNKGLKDFQSGSFYWALRTALSNLGYYETPQKAQLYYEQLNMLKARIFHICRLQENFCMSCLNVLR